MVVFFLQYLVIILSDYLLRFHLPKFFNNIACLRFFHLTGIREHVAAQRFNSGFTRVKFHALDFSEGIQHSSTHSETDVFVPNELKEFFDADVDVLSEISEVIILFVLQPLTTS